MTRESADAATAADGPCLTEAHLEAILPPIPKWMREAPKPAEPRLFE